MTNAILSPEKAFTLVGRGFKFANDREFEGMPDNRKHYWWRAGQDCYVGGIVKYPGKEPALMVFYGDGFMETEEFGLRDALSELATADSRQDVAVNFS